MFRSDQYELLDFGHGRKLERFGQYVLDRPSPAAEVFSQSRPATWSDAQARYERTTGERGVWHTHRPLSNTWTIQHGAVCMELKRTDFGHLGLFPEQAENWDWISQQVAARRETVRVLNLFAYTGGSTLAAAAAGAEVVHVDAAANTVAWARRNAEASGLAGSPIRWITEDAQLFVTRERRRKNAYHGVILDPPSYGHGPKGRTWKLESHLQCLLKDCMELIRSCPLFVLLTCHSPGLQPNDLLQLMSSCAPEFSTSRITTGELSLRTADGRALPSGIFARWSAP